MQRSRAGRWLTRSLPLAICLCAAGVWASEEAAHRILAESDPLRGEYGFLSTFGDITEEAARASVQRLVNDFGILEFQFYDAFHAYSPPPEVVLEQWTTPLFNRPVRRDIIQAYTDEVRKLGGRSWLYVQGMGTDPDDLQVQQGFTVIGKHRVNDQVLLDVVLPTAEWGKRVASPWASFAAALGFAGIHWDMLGNFKDRMSGASMVGDFLRATWQPLQERGLAQTCNFVDGFGWDESLIRGTGWSSNVVAFPYWEAWTLPAVEDRFFKEVAPLAGSVLSCFPGKSPDHDGEVQNKNAGGIWPLDLLISRWEKAHCAGSAYLAIGDGSFHVQTEYLPDKANISQADVTKLRERVFDAQCGGSAGAETSAALPKEEVQSPAGMVGSVPMDPLRGEYGFLTDFESVTEAQARARARGMKESFGILEFQFFDAFEGYSRPPDKDEDEWKNAGFNRLIKRSVVKAYTEEIRTLGGRSWLYVQAMGTDPDDSQVQDGFEVAGAHMIGDRKLLDIVMPTAAWAGKIAPAWAAFAASLGFSGIHWDNIPVGQSVDVAPSDLRAFLQEAARHLAQRGLAQTCTFSRHLPWDTTFSGGVGWTTSLVAFPYWVAWNLPEDEDAFFEQIAPHGGGVYVSYPGKDADHEGESQNENAVGTWPLDLLISRWQKTRCHGSAYIAIGDGARHVQSDYLPDTAAISFKDVTKIRDSVFADKLCSTPNEKDGANSNIVPITVHPEGSGNRLRTGGAAPSSGGYGVLGGSPEIPTWLRLMAFVALVGVSLVSVVALLVRAMTPDGRPPDAAQSPRRSLKVEHSSAPPQTAANAWLLDSGAQS